MTISIGPYGVTSGLICMLDPGNHKCYPGSGTRLFDISGAGNHGTLTNGPTISQVNSGVVVLDGVNDYIDVPIDLSTSSYTVIGAARYVSISNRTFSAKNNNWLMGHWANYTENYYAANWVSTSPQGPSDTLWRFYAAYGDYGNDRWGMYVNGALKVAETTAGINGPNGFAIGSYAGTSEFSNAHIGVFLVYNRVLTAGEVTTIFNSFRGRYGL